MKVAIVGSRDFPGKEEVEPMAAGLVKVYADLGVDWIFVSGGCPDQWAEDTIDFYEIQEDLSPKREFCPRPCVGVRPARRSCYTGTGMHAHGAQARTDEGRWLPQPPPSITSCHVFAMIDIN